MSSILCQVMGDLSLNMGKTTSSAQLQEESEEVWKKVPGTFWNTKITLSLPPSLGTKVEVYFAQIYYKLTLDVILDSSLHT